jgi:hypothetical protein
MLARDISRLWARIWAACAFFSILVWGQPVLTTISDVRLKADGNRFNGLAQITWLSFDSATGGSIAQQSTTVRIIDGNLFIQLTPTSDSTPRAQYLVLYESDGRIQFQETWNVIPSTTPLRIADVRTSQPLFPITGGGGAGGLTTIQESDVTGLVADLTARAVKGPGFSNSRTAIINDTGQIEGALGASTDCVHVDGTSGTCGAGGSPSFSAVTPGTNTGALLVGSGGSLAPTGTGTITPSVGTGLAIVGNAAVVDSAIIPQKNTANSFTVLQTFGAGGILTPGTLPTAGTAGKLWVDSADNNFGIDNGSAWQKSLWFLSGSPPGATSVLAGHATAGRATAISLSPGQTIFNIGGALSGRTPLCSDSTNALCLNTSNNGTAAFTVDASASTVANAVRVPVTAGATATANGALSYDSTNNMLHAAQSSADAFIPQFTVTPGNNDCVKWVVSGSIYKLSTSGSGCGGSVPAVVVTSQLDKNLNQFGVFPLGSAFTGTAYLSFQGPLMGSALGGGAGSESQLTYVATSAFTIIGFCLTDSNGGSQGAGAGGLTINLRHNTTDVAGSTITIAPSAGGPTAAAPAGRLCTGALSENIVVGDTVNYKIINNAATSTIQPYQLQANVVW